MLESNPARSSTSASAPLAPPRNSTRIIALCSMALAAASCQVVGRTTALPLYPNSGPRPGPERVATLHGPIASVDGRSVSQRGMTFELMPGCHVVALRGNVGRGNDNGAWAASLPRIVYAFEMKPGHGYAIKADLQETSSLVGRVVITARERRPDGSVTRVPAARSDADIGDCRRWATARGL